MAATLRQSEDHRDEYAALFVSNLVHLTGRVTSQARAAAALTPCVSICQYPEAGSPEIYALAYPPIAGQVSTCVEASRTWRLLRTRALGAIGLFRHG